MDNVIASQELQVERKHYYIEFRENERGRFLRITEEAHGRRNTVIVPSTGLNEFNAAIDAVVVAANAANGVSPASPPISPSSANSAA
jgi:PurA ssDNA and RNA-binding protein